MQDYLRTVLDLRERSSTQGVRVKDIADTLGVRMPSVTSAVGTLRRHGLVRHERYASVELTELGEAMAAELMHRRRTLVAFLTSVLHLDSETAREQACGLEHSLGTEAALRLERLVDFVEQCPACRRRLMGKSGPGPGFESCGNCDECPARAAEEAAVAE